MTASARPAQRSTRRSTTAIAPERVAVLDQLEKRLMEISARTRAGLRQAAAVVHPDMQPFGILMLRHIEEFGPSTAGTLATQLQVDKSVISRQTKLLEQFGFIKVTTSSVDRRQRVITLTRKAITRLQALDPGGASRLEARLHTWSTTDLTRLSRYLELLLMAAEDVPLDFTLDEA